MDDNARKGDRVKDHTHDDEGGTVRTCSACATERKRASVARLTELALAVDAPTVTDDGTDKRVIGGVYLSHRTTVRGTRDRVYIGVTHDCTRADHAPTSVLFSSVGRRDRMGYEPPRAEVNAPPSAMDAFADRHGACHGGAGAHMDGPVRIGTRVPRMSARALDARRTFHHVTQRANVLGTLGALTVPGHDPRDARKRERAVLAERMADVVVSGRMSTRPVVNPHSETCRALHADANARDRDPRSGDGACAGCAVERGAYLRATERLVLTDATTDALARLSRWSLPSPDVWTRPARTYVYGARSALNGASV